MSDLYYKRDDCRLCGSVDLDLAVPMAPIPIATPNLGAPENRRESPLFREAVPLDLYLCRECFHLQVLHVANPEVQYGNYVYTTSLSFGLANHFQAYADAVLSARLPASDSLVVEFGSNDGTLLRCFKEKGMRVIGIDPASDIAEQATRSGVETINAFFSLDIARQIRETHGPADIIIANNVIANIDDMVPVALGIKELMAPDGVFVFETQYGADVIKKKLLDTVYHEHLSYFNIRPLAAFFERHGMQVIDVEHIETKGGSIHVTVQHMDGTRTPSHALSDALEEEDNDGMNGLGCYQGFSDEIEALRSRLKAIADEHHGAGKTVGGYGMSVGTTTLLAQFGLTEKIDFLFDDDPDKESALSGPGYDIPVFSPETVYEKNPGAIIVFAWRYAEPIMAKHERYLEEGGKFIIPLPKIAIVQA